MKDTYVYDNVEVVLTGRIAKKEQPLSKPGSRSRARPPAPRTDDNVLYEITPKDSEEGSWRKWERLSSLYKIQDQGETE